MRNSLARRVLWVHVILLLALCGVLLRIFVIGQGEQYRQTAAAQSRYTLSAGTARGNIYDCRLRPLVNESEKTVLAVDPTPAAMTALRQGLSAEQFEEIYPLLQSGRPVLLPSDFPISGEGITALQMDNKAGGITRDILTQALEQAKKGRFQILDIMDKTIPAPRPELSSTAPKIITINIDPEKIREVIGPGGKMIRSIVQRTGAKIDVDDSGRVYIAAVNDDSAKSAVKIINDLVREVKPGETFVGTATRMMSFGVFVEVLPGKEGLLHVSEISNYHVPRLEDAINTGDKVLVTVKEIDDMHRVNLSRKRILDQLDELAKDPEFAEQAAIEKEREERFSHFPRSEGGPRREGSPRHDDGGRPPRRDFGSDRGSEHRPVRRFERERKK